MLAAALLVILLVAALVAGVFAAATEETHISSASAAREQALVAAESALAAAIGSWTGRRSQQIGVGGAELSTTGGVIPVSLTVTRLDSTLYSIVAEARSPSSHSQAVRRIGVIVSVKIAADSSLQVDPIPHLWWSEIL